VPDVVSLPVLALDLAAAVRVIRSAAIAQAMAEATQLTWQTYNDSKALNIVYTVLFWKGKPGWVEVNTGSQDQILRRTDELTAQYWKSFYAKLTHGPAAVVRSLQAFERARAQALDSIRMKFEDARAINNDVLAYTRLAVRDLARIKLASDVVIAVAAPPVVSVPYAMTATFIKDVEKAESAKVLVFAVGKEPAKEGMKQLSEKGSHLLAREAGGYATALKNAELDIIRQNDLLRRRSATAKSAARASVRLEDATASAVAARQSVRFARAGQVTLKGLAWGFVAYDVYEAWHDYTDAVGL
jgi:hypothetical protein